MMFASRYGGISVTIGEFQYSWGIHIGNAYVAFTCLQKKKKMKENKMREKNNVDFFFNNDEKHPSTITGLPKRSFYAYGYIIESGILSRVFGHQMPGISAPAS